METSRAALVFSLLMCSSWTILSGSAMGDEDAVPPLLLNLTSMANPCEECQKAVKLLTENFNASTTKKDISDALSHGILSRNGHKCNSWCREFVKKNMEKILERIHGEGLKDICNYTNSCPHPIGA